MSRLKKKELGSRHRTQNLLKQCVSTSEEQEIPLRSKPSLKEAKQQLKPAPQTPRVQISHARASTPSSSQLDGHQNSKSSKNAHKHHSYGEQEVTWQKKYPKAKHHRKAKTIDSTITISDDEDELRDNFNVPKKTINPQELLELLEELSKVEDPDEIRNWFRNYGVRDLDVITRFRDVFSNLSRSLNTSRPNDPTTEQLFIYRNRYQKLMFLSPIETFHGSRSLQRKTVGFVRRKGLHFPLIYSTSGWESATRTHPKMLDSRTWTENVVKFCQLYGCELKIGWEKGQMIEDVSETASHVEIKLMLWYAYRLLGKETGRIPELKKLHTLQKLRPHPAAEIVISEKPCIDCFIFQQRIQEVTGIKFSFYAHPNLGKIKKSRTRACSSYSEYPMDPKNSSDEDSADEESADELGQEIVVKRQACKRPLPKSPKAGKKVARENEELAVEVSNHRTKKRKHTAPYEADESDEWEPLSTPTSSKKQRSLPAPAAPVTPANSKANHRNGLVTPPETPPSSSFAVVIPPMKKCSIFQFAMVSPTAAKEERKSQNIYKNAHSSARNFSRH